MVAFVHNQQIRLSWIWTDLLDEIDSVRWKRTRLSAFCYRDAYYNCTQL